MGKEMNLLFIAFVFISQVYGAIEPVTAEVEPIKNQTNVTVDETDLDNILKEYNELLDSNINETEPTLVEEEEEEEEELVEEEEEELVEEEEEELVGYEDEELVEDEEEE